MVVQKVVGYRVARFSWTISRDSSTLVLRKWEVMRDWTQPMDVTLHMQVVQSLCREPQWRSKEPTTTSNTNPHISPIFYWSRSQQKVSRSTREQLGKERVLGSSVLLGHTEEIDGRSWYPIGKHRVVHLIYIVGKELLLPFFVARSIYVEISCHLTQVEFSLSKSVVLASFLVQSIYNLSRFSLVMTPGASIFWGQQSWFSRKLG